MSLRRTRIGPAVAAFLAVAGVVTLGSPAAIPSIPSIYVNYNSPNCTFTMTVDGGITVSSATAPGPTLPPGTYELEVNMLNPAAGYACAKPVFTFTGPGVSSVTEFRGKELHDERVVTLAASSTYVAQDENGAAATRRVFTTAASGSNSVLVGSGSGSQTGSLPGTVSEDIVGSAVLRFRGKLAATVTSAGKATLKLGSRNVGTLKAGKYDIRVDDRTARGGFFVRRGSRNAVVVTGLAYVGQRTRRVSLAMGQWVFFSKVGKPIPFVVVD